MTRTLAFEIQGLEVVTGLGSERPRTFSIRRQFFFGERIAVMGPSGCGKSTLLKLLTGIPIRASKGIQIGGRQEVEGIHKRIRIGYLPQDSRDIVLPWKSVREQVGDDAIEGLSLDMVSHRLPAHLSGGELRRVGLGHVMSLGGKDVLLLDEPFNGLDPDTRSKAISFVKRLITGGRVLVFITHYREEAVEMEADFMTLAVNPAPNGLGVP